jgi:23S rRNA-/tRNA-specific pseudouridylate synthase
MAVKASIVHRLDKDTTGLMVCQDDKAHRALSKAFAEKTEGAERGYLALSGARRSPRA